MDVPLIKVIGPDEPLRAHSPQIPVK
jgi:hypothetical protein